MLASRWRDANDSANDEIEDFVWSQVWNLKNIFFVYYFLNEYLIFYYQVLTAQKTGMGRWQEVSEVFLAAGFLIFAYSCYKKVSRQATFLNKPNLENNPLL